MLRRGGNKKIRHIRRGAAIDDKRSKRLWRKKTTDTFKNFFKRKFFS